MRIAVIAAAILILGSCGETAKADPWRADEHQLLGRVENLAGSGDVDAAAGVLTELERRGNGAVLDRGRVALARGLLAAGRGDDALKRLREVAWADKSPAIAGELVGLELAIRWRGVLDADGVLRSGRIPARDDHDSDQGRPGGAWQARRDSFAAIAAVLAGPARMVEREGGRVALPAENALIALARYAHGAAAWTDTAAAMGDPAGWSPALAMAVVRLHLAEHDPERAIQAAEVLWRQHPGTSEAGTAFRELRLWQLRRRAASFLRLWSYPAIETRLDALAQVHAAAEAESRAAVAAEADLGGATMARTMREKVTTTSTVVVPQFESEGVIGLDADPVVVVAEEKPPAPRMEWRLATVYDGVSLALPSEPVPAGDPLAITATGAGGPCRIELWRIADPAAWERLCSSPRREDLPAAPVWSTESAEPAACSVPSLPEGRYVATATMRACPVVLMRSVRIASTAIHVEAGAESLVTWAVNRRDGRSREGLAMAATIELARNTERAAGAAWAGADPAWRSGFAEGFTGNPDRAWRGSGQEQAFAAGKAAGEAAAKADPPLVVELAGSTGEDGIWRAELPDRLAGRSWSARVRVAAPGIDEAATVAWGAEANWTSRAVAWADKPFVRPGETLRFAALLRDHDGDRFRLPVGRIAASVSMGNETLWSGELVIGSTGMVSGAVQIPPGVQDGDAYLTLGGGSGHHLARCERLAVPPLTITVAGDEGASVRAGEPHQIRVRLHDAAGEAIAGAEVTCRAGPVGGRGEDIQATTDLAGEAVFSIPTASGAEGEFSASISTRREHRRWKVNHAWTVSSFPFPLRVEAAERETEVGGQIRVRLGLPAGAQVQLRLKNGQAQIGDQQTATGGADGHAEVLVPVDAVADTIEVFCPVLGGGEACQRLAIAVRPRPVAGDGDPVACLPERTRLRPGEDLAVAVGCAPSGRDALLLVGARNLISVSRVGIEEAAARTVLRVEGSWGPSCHVQALAWLPGRGFSASTRSELEVLPVDRLLSVEIALPHDDWRPGERVEGALRVRDWKGRPVAGAAITLGVVDERLFALAEDGTPDLLAYFHHGRRPWELVAGRDIGIGMVYADFWRSVIRRWQPVEADERSDSRTGGGRSRVMACRGGAGRISESEIRSLGGEADPCIAWVAGAQTGADGSVPVSFVLPAHAAAFRLTARAADASAAVLVGEVRTRIAARRGIGLHLSVPAVVRTGDRIQVLAEVANHQDRERTLRLRWFGSERAVPVGPRARRIVPLQLDVPAPPADAQVARCGDLLGHRLRLEAVVADGDETVSSASEVLCAAGGLPESRSLRLVADQDGRLALPDPVPAGALVRLAVRAWPDAAARRADELGRWRAGGGVRHVAAWLVAPAGRERREALASTWRTLDDSAAAIALRTAAARRGDAGISISKVPDGLLGDWLLARGRAAGLGLPAPRLRGAPGSSATERAAAAACALAEGWSEGHARWRALLDELTDSDDPQALAIAVDGARLAGDAGAAATLVARLARLDWSDDLVAVLAADLLPDAVAAAPAVIALDGADREVRLDGAVGAEWLGGLRAPLSLRAPAGALVAVELDWQIPAEPARVDDEAPRLEIWQGDGDGYRVLPPGSAAWPGRPLLLVVDARHCANRWTVDTALPALVRPGRGKESVLLLRPQADLHPLPQADQSRLSELAETWEQAAPAARSAARSATLAGLADCLQRCPAIPGRLGDRHETLGTETGLPADAAGLISLQAQGITALALVATGEGLCAWPDAVAYGNGGRRIALAGPAVRIAVSQESAASRHAGHPLAERIRAAAERLSAAEIRWLLAGNLASDEEWLGALAILDPAARHSLADIQRHPLSGQPGHWTSTQIRRFVDAEPAFDQPSPELREGDPSLGAIIDAVTAARNEAAEAWGMLPAPQPAPARERATVRAWYERLAGAGSWEAVPFATWIWTQEVDANHLAGLGYDSTIDGWMTFCRRELGLDLRIASGALISVPCGEPGKRVPMDWKGGSALGTRCLAEVGLSVVALPGGAFELRAQRPEQRDLRALPAPVTLEFQDKAADEALSAFNQLLANRGLPPVRFDGVDPAGLPPITLKVADMAWTDVTSWMARVWGLRYEGRALRR